MAAAHRGRRLAAPTRRCGGGDRGHAIGVRLRLGRPGAEAKRARRDLPAGARPFDASEGCCLPAAARGASSKRRHPDRAASASIPGTCRHGLVAGGEGRAWRVAVDDAPIAFTDRLQGRQQQRLDRDVGDFVVKRADGLFAYQLAVVVDDALQGITDVVRGADLLASTPRQIWLQRQLGFATPAYLHHPIAIDRSGRKLSKETGAAQLPDDPLPALWRRMAVSRTSCSRASAAVGVGVLALGASRLGCARAASGGDAAGRCRRGKPAVRSIAALGEPLPGPQRSPRYNRAMRGRFSAARACRSIRSSHDHARRRPQEQ